MKLSTTVARLAVRLSWVVLAILALLPFHAFLTVWASSGVGHYTLLRLWKEFLLVPVFVGVVYLLAMDKRLRRKLFDSWIVRLIGLYVVLELLAGAIALARHQVTAKALAYGVLVDLRFLIFFVLVLVLAAAAPMLGRTWRVGLVLPATVVIIFGLLQYFVLPYDFLRHFGYGQNTIFPYETINHNLNHLRIASTLRGANPLGTYLILVTGCGLALLLRSKPKRPSEFVWLAAAFLALILSFSRGAWIGAALTLLIIGWLHLPNRRAKKNAVIAGLITVIVAGVTAFGLRNNVTFQDTFLHTDSKSTITQSSNQGHGTAVKNASDDIVHQPLGRGPGTAGPASAYNNHPARIAENYFLQIGQEVGVLGMALFVAINVLVGMELWRQPLFACLDGRHHRLSLVGPGSNRPGPCYT